MSGHLFAHLFGGQFLLLRGGLVRHWKFILYLFFLIIVYITIHFGVKDTLLTKVRNDNQIKNLKSEYTGKNTRLLYLSKRGEIEKILKKNKSSVKAAVNPPTIIRASDK